MKMPPKAIKQKVKGVYRKQVACADEESEARVDPVINILRVSELSAPRVLSYI